MTDDQIWEIIATEVAAAIRRSMLETYGSIKTTVIELFDERYAALTKVATIAATVVVDIVRIGGGRAC